MAELANLEIKVKVDTSEAVKALDNLTQKIKDRVLLDVFQAHIKEPEDVLDIEGLLMDFYQAMVWQDSWVPHVVPEISAIDVMRFTNGARGIKRRALEDE